jgi:hypothetical protein
MKWSMRERSGRVSSLQPRLCRRWGGGPQCRERRMPCCAGAPFLRISHTQLQPVSRASRALREALRPGAPTATEDYRHQQHPHLGQRAGARLPRRWRHGDMAPILLRSLSRRAVSQGAPLALIFAGGRLFEPPAEAQAFQRLQRVQRVEPHAPTRTSCVLPQQARFTPLTRGETQDTPP